MKRSEGQGTVEFALALPVLLLIAFMLLQLTDAVRQSSTLTFAVREGARYAIVRGAGSGAPATADDIRAAVLRYTTAVRSPIVTVAWPDGGNATGERVSVDVEATVQPLPFVPAFSLTVRAGTTQVIAR